MRLGGFRIIILPGNGLVKVKKLKVLKKFPKKSGINLDMSFNYFCHLKLTCLFLKPSKGHVYIYIYIRKKLFLTQIQSKNNISLKVVSKGVLFGMYVACRANVYSKSGNKIT